jgi:hypothetical protein
VLAQGNVVLAKEAFDWNDRFSGITRLKTLEPIKSNLASVLIPKFIAIALEASCSQYNEVTGYMFVIFFISATRSQPKRASQFSCLIHQTTRLTSKMRLLWFQQQK